MLFTVLKELKSISLPVDGVELRLDCFPYLDFQELKKFVDHSGIPILFTLRTKAQGGEFEGNPKDLILKLLDLRPHFIDVEKGTSSDFMEKIAKSYPDTKILLSTHNFAETPKNLEEILSSMRHPSVYAYKIATMATSTNDALRMLSFVKRHTPRMRLCGLCMGKCGEVTRILGPVVGNFINYASLEEGKESAPGQLTVSTLLNTYNYRSLNPQTALYGLIGDPVDKSIGYLTHNAIMRQSHLAAVYVRMPVKKEELPLFFPLIQEVGFSGLSVTMPLKEDLFPYITSLDLDAEKIGAVNTLLFAKGKVAGYNTDGKGALDAIESHTPVKGKVVVLLGAGGAAKAIAYEAHRRGSRLYILNRTPARALELASHIGCRGGGMQELLDIEYELLINSTPDPQPIDPALLRPNSFVMDCKTYPKMTPLLEQAAAKGCSLIFGWEMFLHQALEQFRLWFSQEIELSLLEKECNKALN